MVAVTFVLALLKYQVSDVLYVLLSGSVVAAGFALATVLRGASAAKAGGLLCFALVGSLAAWGLGQILCRLTTVWLIGNAALAYDLLLGVIGAVTVGCAKLERTERVRVI